MTTSIEEPLQRERQAVLEETEFYRRMWSSRWWGTREPNEDESIRWRAIESLIGRHAANDLPRPLQIVDVGCGRGWLSNQAARFGTVLGIDVTESSVERARALFPALEFATVSGSDLLATSDRRFDLVLSSEVIEHVPDEQKREFMTALYGLLVPGGLAILTTPRGELWRRWKAAHPKGQPVEAWISEAELDALAGSVGFSICERRRAFLPGVRYASCLSRFLASRPFRKVPALLELPGLRALRQASSIYQIVALRR